ncbi:MAG: sugar transferase [Neptuniibacter sp.]
MNTSLLIRLTDLTLAFFGLLLLSPLLLIVCVIAYMDTRSPLLLQTRVGRNLNLFVLVKFRTMYPDTKHVATHQADASAITPLGKYLRKTKLDELPQLWNVLMGEMSLVGPRPCLPSQSELIRCRDELKVFDVRPGITGLAQINHIDMSTPELLAETDAKMIQTLTMPNYFGYIFKTVAGNGQGDRVK